MKTVILIAMIAVSFFYVQCTNFHDQREWVRVNPAANETAEID